jgi:hypothetical protein
VTEFSDLAKWGGWGGGRYHLHRTIAGSIGNWICGIKLFTACSLQLSSATSCTPAWKELRVDFICRSADLVVTWSKDRYTFWWSEMQSAAWRNTKRLIKITDVWCVTPCSVVQEYTPYNKNLTPSVLDFRLPTLCKWNLRSSWVLCSVNLWISTIREILKDGSHTLSRNVGKKKLPICAS